MKRRFEFRLKRVARVRELEERVARAERASAENLARAAEASRDRARSVLARSRAWLAAALKGKIEPRSILGAQRSLDAEVARLAREVESARTLRAQAERIAAAHLARRSAARALEELRNRERTRHAALLAGAENAALDEIATQRSRERADREERAPATDENDSRSSAPEADRAPGPSPDPQR